MEDYIQFSAKTKSEAITKACIELGVSSDQLEIQVISEGSNGFFGIGSKPAVIKVRKIEPVSEEEEMKEIVETVKLDSFKEEAPVQEEKKTEAIKPVKKEIKEPKAVSEKPRQPKSVKERAAKEKQPREFREPKEKQVREKTAKPAKSVEILTDPEEIKEVENRAKVFLRDVFASMNLGEVEITSEYNTTDGSLEVDFEGEDMGILIGKRGQTLDSLQYLTSLVVNKGKSNYIRVKLDTEDYRKRRKETLENLARGIAYKVRKTRKPVILEPMNPYERRIIHSALQGNKFVETVSEGEEPYRHVVVKLKRN
ncbi:RNA-binding cell elongation regulator Jag/EloR [Blautia wexlerae]|uniref:RNA-binding cell elongation regulator Jag/EloR n=1 Tax=Blautia wexlerae TaxID=418240 RepID=UPI0015710AD4|nr:RNA-binding cell elongation regulator Jag/EloR [Blautia wexlerae]MCB5556724.1 Jag N-terminal domain-containing protein [Blautia wexlerae]NSG02531.1 KH domain-containing protein [Blautia wexlerae]